MTPLRAPGRPPILNRIGYAIEATGRALAATAKVCAAPRNARNRQAAGVVVVLVMAVCVVDGWLTRPADREPPGLASAEVIGPNPLVRNSAVEGEGRVCFEAFMDVLTEPGYWYYTWTDDAGLEERYETGAHRFPTRPCGSTDPPAAGTPEAAEGSP